MKNSKNNNIILGFSFMYLVSVYPTNRTLVSLPNHYIYPQLFNKSEKVEHIYRYLNNNLAFIFEETIKVWL